MLTNGSDCPYLPPDIDSTPDFITIPTVLRHELQFEPMLPKREDHSSMAFSEGLSGSDEEEKHFFGTFNSLLISNHFF